MRKRERGERQMAKTPCGHCLYYLLIHFLAFFSFWNSGNWSQPSPLWGSHYMEPQSQRKSTAPLHPWHPCWTVGTAAALLAASVSAGATSSCSAQIFRLTDTRSQTFLFWKKKSLTFVLTVRWREGRRQRLISDVFHALWLLWWTVLLMENSTDSQTWCCTASGDVSKTELITIFYSTNQNCGIYQTLATSSC